MIMHFMIDAKRQLSVPMQEVVCLMCSHAETLQGVEFGVATNRHHTIHLVYLT